MDDRTDYSDVPSSVLIYSENWTHLSALKPIFSGCGYYENSGREVRLSAQNRLDTLISSLAMMPDVIILDISQGCSLALFLSMREHCPQAIIIYMQHRFLYSDRMTAEYFGGVQLKEYGALMVRCP